MAKINGEFTKWALRILLVTLITAVSTVLSFHEGKLTANDKESRERDHSLEERITQVNDNIHLAVLEQNTINGKTNVVLERILVKLEVIEENGTN